MEEIAHRDDKASAMVPVGDIGVVVDVDGNTGRMLYMVECADSDGPERWLAEFDEEDLEAIPPG